MVSIRTPLLLASFAAAAFLSHGGAQAQSSAGTAFYQGKTIQIIVTTGAGGGYDLIARTAARYLPQYVPGKPSFVVQNMPGAGSIRGTNHIYNVEAKNSLVMGCLGNQVPFAPLLGMKQALFDPTKLNWLGSPSYEVGLILVWHTVPINTIEEAKQREVIVATSGGGSTSDFYVNVFNGVLGTKLKAVAGYNGLTGALLAMERGEVEGYPSAFWSSLKATKADWIRKKKVKILLQYGPHKPHPELMDVPLARDLVTTDEDRQIIDIATAALNLGRPFVMPPGVPEDHVKIMRNALLAVFKNKNYIADSEKQGLEVNGPITGEALEAIIQTVYSAPKPVIDRLVSYLPK